MRIILIISTHSKPSGPRSELWFLLMKFLNKKNALPTKRQGKSRGCKKLFPLNPKIRDTPLLTFALLNSDGLRHKLLELSHILASSKLANKIAIPDILAITESHQNDADDFKIKGYKWIGKPSTKTSSSVGGSAGVGFWVKNKIEHACMIASDALKQHKDILWIQLITLEGVYFFASVCSNPGTANLENHIDILETLKLNIAYLKKLGTIVIAGDLNADLRRHNEENKGHTHELKKFLRTTKFRTLVPMEISSNAGHSFKAPQGASNPDHILVHKNFADSIEHFQIHQDITIGSDHCMLSTSFRAPLTPEKCWDSPDTTYTKWSDENISLFTEGITPKLTEIRKSLRLPATTKDDADWLAASIKNALASCLRSIQTNAKSLGDHSTGEEVTNRAILLLITKRNSKMAKPANKAKNWHEIHELQRQIVLLGKGETDRKNRIWWEKIQATDMDVNPKEFWKLAKKLQRSSLSVFPSCLTDDDEKTVKGRENIMKHIAGYYQSIAEATDKEAADFYKEHNILEKDLEVERGIARRRLAKNIKINKDSANAQIGINSPITETEVRKAISKSKNSTAPGLGGILSECFEAWRIFTDRTANHTLPIPIYYGAYARGMAKG